jgi:hypothetical protein
VKKLQLGPFDVEFRAADQHFGDLCDLGDPNAVDNLHHNVVQLADGL